VESEINDDDEVDGEEAAFDKQIEEEINSKSLSNEGAPIITE